MNNDTHIIVDLGTGPYKGETIFVNDVLYVCTHRAINEEDAMCFLTPYPEFDYCDICGEPEDVCTCNEFEE